MTERLIKNRDSAWIKAFRNMYQEALPEARKTRIENLAGVGQAKMFLDLVNSVAKELNAETDLMLSDLTSAAQLLRLKIEDFYARHPEHRVKEKAAKTQAKPRTVEQDIEEFI